MGLATSAGLNAYIPLLTFGLLARYTDVVTLPSSWGWLENGWTLGIVAVLLVVEVIADKVPVVDHVNDVLQTVVRPTSGGLVFGAAAGSQSVTVDNPGEFFSGDQWVPIAVGVLISLAVHGAKASVRPVVNATTGGLGAPVVSALEDIASATLAVVAIVLPALVLILLFAMVIAFWRLLRLRRRRRAAKQAAREAPGRLPVR